MPMTFEQAGELQLLRRKLSVLRDNATDANKRAAAEAQIERIEPYMDTAAAIVMARTDNDFQEVADALKAAMKPLDDAIADIKKISAAITQAASLIDALVKVLGKLGVG